MPLSIKITEYYNQLYKEHMEYVKNNPDCNINLPFFLLNLAKLKHENNKIKEKNDELFLLLTERNIEVKKMTKD